MKKLLLPPVFALLCLSSHAQENRITIDAGASLGEISPYVYGQFVEYMGRCIDGGIFDEDSPLSDSRGFRRDVLEKVKELSPTMLRFPGGTAVKTFHWEDGVGPKEERKARKNLIWGGINDFHFGTCEFIEYCREIGAEPCLVVNLSTGSPDEAANWVEYCNGTENTYYANLRRSHGYPEPFGVKYWALGNEEGAEPDAGRHQDPRKYVEDVWHFIKLMKLTDPSIKLIANGEGGDMRWNETILDGLGGAVDYISYHNYVNTEEGKPYSLFRKIKAADRGSPPWAPSSGRTARTPLTTGRYGTAFPLARTVSESLSTNGESGRPEDLPTGRPTPTNGVTGWRRRIFSTPSTATPAT